MSEEHAITAIKKDLNVVKKGVDKYFVRGIIFLILVVAFGLLSIFSFSGLVVQGNVLYMIGLIVGILATFCWAYEADKYFNESNECKKVVSMLNTAIWIVTYWVKDKRLEPNFYKCVNVKTDDEYDEALSFLRKGSYIENC